MLKESIVRMKDLPSNERPIERLVKYGAESLSIQELLSIIIGSGTSGMCAKNLALKIMNNTNISELRNINVDELIKFRGIGYTKAARILASLEISNRISFHQQTSAKKYVNESIEAYYLLKPLFNGKNRENLYSIYLSGNNLVIEIVKIASGSRGNIFINMKDILRKALQLDSEKIIIAHNHPSGDPEPSVEDINFTKKLAEQCKLFDIAVVDHLIISDFGYTSIISKTSA
ncbi:MAG: DNA repair protein RadC [Candidatus Thermoplasmatota archaeon]|nr:DNA repair protein RadC [Candidatus Thermoplasmatota archaeon]MCL5963925.1 DNA repair protein RadC [Candidatus Thermoplasmatota archaeon]